MSGGTAGPGGHVVLLHRYKIFWLLLNRENGTFCNHHVGARKIQINLHISRERLGVRRWNFHQTVAHGVVYLMRVSSCTELYGFQKQYAEI